MPYPTRIIMNGALPTPGFVLDAKDWTAKRVLHLVKTVQYTKEARE